MVRLPFVGTAFALAGVLAGAACAAPAEPATTGDDSLQSDPATTLTADSEDELDLKNVGKKHRENYCRKHPDRCDAGADATSDAAADSSSDSGQDTWADTGVDAGADTGVDAGSDTGVDAGPPSLCNPAPPGTVVCDDFDHVPFWPGGTGCFANCDTTKFVSAPASYFITILDAQTGGMLHAWPSVNETGTSFTLDFDVLVGTLPTSPVSPYIIGTIEIDSPPPVLTPLNIGLSETGQIGVGRAAIANFASLGNPHVWNHVQIICNATTLSILVNGISEVNIPTIFAPKAGLWTFSLGLTGNGGNAVPGVQINFDNVVLTSP